LSIIATLTASSAHTHSVAAIRLELIHGFQLFMKPPFNPLHGKYASDRKGLNIRLSSSNSMRRLISGVTPSSSSPSM